MDYFPQKGPIISGSFAKNDLQLKAFYESSPSYSRITPQSQRFFDEFIRLKMEGVYARVSSWLC